LDGDLDTWWEAAPGHTNGTLTLTLPAAVTLDVISLQEAVDHRTPLEEHSSTSSPR
jgi:alpha-L-fucosidase